MRPVSSLPWTRRWPRLQQSTARWCVPQRRPYHPTVAWSCSRAICVLLCPNGALIKVAGLQSLTFTGPALVFENEEDCMQVVRARTYAAGSVIIIRHEGPKGGPGMREMLE